MDSLRNALYNDPLGKVYVLEYSSSVLIYVIVTMNFTDAQNKVIERHISEEEMNARLSHTIL